MITTAVFKKQIAKPFGQEMRKCGFKGSGFEYFQDTSEYLISIYITPGRWGCNCSTGFAIHPKEIDRDYNGKRELARLKLHQYEFRMSVDDSNGNRRWSYAEDEAKNLETLQSIIEIIKSKILPVINLFKAQPSILELFRVSELKNFHDNWGRRTGMRIATTDLRFAWALTVIFENKNHEKAKQFAKWGMSNLEEDGDPWFGKADFERVLSHKSTPNDRD